MMPQKLIASLHCTKCESHVNKMKPRIIDNNSTRHYIVKLRSMSHINIDEDTIEIQCTKLFTIFVLNTLF